MVIGILIGIPTMSGGGDTTPPAASRLLTEGGDFLTTEAGDHLITES